MFLHIGADKSVPIKDIIGIFNVKIERNPKYSFLSEKMSSEIIDISAGNPKTFIVTTKYIYLSAISPLTITKRAKHGMSTLVGKEDIFYIDRG